MLLEEGEQLCNFRGLSILAYFFAGRIKTICRIYLDRCDKEEYMTHAEWVSAMNNSLADKDNYSSVERELQSMVGTLPILDKYSIKQLSEFYDMTQKLIDKVKQAKLDKSNMEELLKMSSELKEKSRELFDFDLQQEFQLIV